MIANHVFVHTQCSHAHRHWPPRMRSPTSTCAVHWPPCMRSPTSTYAVLTRTQTLASMHALIVLPDFFLCPPPTPLAQPSFSGHTPHAHSQASLAVHKVMAELKLLSGPLEHLEIRQRIGSGGFGVVHAGEGGLGDAGGQGGEGGGPTTLNFELERHHHLHVDLHVISTWLSMDVTLTMSTTPLHARHALF